MDVFLDTNVLLDVIGEREPFLADSLKVWTLADEGRVRAFISVLSFANVYYVTRRESDRAKAERAMGLMRASFQPVPFDEPILHQAIGGGLNDFEDAIQLFSALRCGAECLVTRNPTHFPSEGIRVMTPAEFVAACFPDETPP